MNIFRKDGKFEDRTLQYLFPKRCPAAELCSVMGLCPTYSKQLEPRNTDL